MFIEINGVVSSLLALALLPSERINDAFEFIRVSTAPAYVDIFLPLVEYFDTFWLATVTQNSPHMATNKPSAIVLSPLSVL